MEELEALKEAAKEDPSYVYGEDSIETPLGDFVRVKSLRGSRHRWYDEMEEIYKSPSGRLYALPWQRGHTESQENEYQPENAFEVEAYEVTVTRYREKKNG